MKRPLNIYWVRNDLRLKDNEALSYLSGENGEALFVWCPSKSIHRAGQFRKSFVDACLFQFNEDLRIYGQSLFISPYNALETLQRLSKLFQIRNIVFTQEHAHEERQDEGDICAFAHGIRADVRAFDQSTLIRLSDLPFSIENMPFGFSPFRRKVEESLRVLPPLASPQSLPFLERTFPSEVSFLQEPAHQASSHPCIAGGERAGLQRLSHFIWNSKAVRAYKETRNGLMNWDDSSKLSPWLSVGALSPRTILSEIQKFEEEVEKNESTYWLFFELLWRDYFKFFSLKYGGRIFLDSSSDLKEDTSVISASRALERWKEARTGDDFVDAHMTELLLTGWMSNRGRQNVASYLIHQLGVSWTLGAGFFEKMLIDYDVDVNWGNWHYLSGQGSDPRSRVFNTQRQAQMYDPHREYQNLWLNRRTEVKSGH